MVALAATVEVERSLIEQDLLRYEDLAERRAALTARLVELYRALDGAMRVESAVRDERGLRILDEIDKVETERTAILASTRNLVERLIDRDRRVLLLQAQIDALEGRERESGGLLEGRWEVVLLPLAQRGTFDLRQTGTLVSGTYRLDGGFSGSVQGTLVNRKVFLVRIDSKLGRSMEFEGFLSGDGLTIRGTWLDYELAAGDGSAGQWSASRR